MGRSCRWQSHHDNQAHVFLDFFVVSMHDYRVESAIDFVVDVLHGVGDLGYVSVVSLRDLWFWNDDFGIVFREN